MNFDAEKATRATVEWIRDWFGKNGPGCNAIVGISGGKDSSIAAALCAEALGRDHVSGCRHFTLSDRAATAESLTPAISPRTGSVILQDTVTLSEISVLCHALLQQRSVQSDGCSDFRRFS